MKKLATKWFKKWSRKVNLGNQELLDAIRNLEEGLSTADLGGGLYKVRVKGRLKNYLAFNLQNVQSFEDFCRLNMPSYF